jgi:hypothetical protein
MVDYQRTIPALATFGGLSYIYGYFQFRRIVKLPKHWPDKLNRPSELHVLSDPSLTIADLIVPSASVTHCLESR